MSSIINVVKTGVCVGCGACTVITGSRIPLTKSFYGVFSADISKANDRDLSIASAVCPMADESKNEDQIASIFLENIDKYDSKIGKYLSIHAGRITSESDIINSSSGGITTWLELNLLEKGLIDGVIHVGGDNPTDGLFTYCVSYDADSIRERKKSQYYATNSANVLQSIRGDGRSYAFVGVPCFIKSLRLLVLQDVILKSQIKFFIGLVCGHLKSAGFAEALAWQIGISPEQITKVDFRVKEPGKSSSDYSFRAWKKGSDEPATAPTRSLLGGNWGHALFQIKACDYCDDIFAETSDVVFGDAWLKEYINDWRGTNVVISRNHIIDSLLKEGIKTKALDLENISVEQVAASQDGNFRHRWDGLSIRLEDDAKGTGWVPNKRIRPGSRKVSNSRKRIVRLRRKLAEVSHKVFFEAKVSGRLDLFIDGVAPLIAEIEKEYQSGWRLRAKRIAKKFLKVLRISR